MQENQNDTIKLPKVKQILKNVLDGYVRINNLLYLENTSIRYNIFI